MTKEFDMEEVRKYILSFYYNTKGMTRTARHNYLQSKICVIAHRFNLIGDMEYPCKYVSPKGELRQGYIDVVWLDSNNNVVVAIEIDSSVRPKSYIKLNTIKANNKIWLYCGKNNSKFEEANSIYNDNNSIEVIRP